MKHITKYVGLDVAKETIAVAVAESGRSEARFVGTIPTRSKQSGSSCAS